jgi:hypothetical protein
MNKKIMLFGILIISLMISANTALAIMPGFYYAQNNYNNYNNYQGNSFFNSGYPYYSNRARIGGFFGANTGYISGLRQGYYATPRIGSWSRVNSWNSYYPRVGGAFGQPTYYSYFMAPRAIVLRAGN